jgi:hypothetical protein
MPSSRKLARSTGLNAVRSSGPRIRHGQELRPTRSYFLNYADTELDIPAGAV